MGLPLTAKQAKELKQFAEQAPYGKGTETVVDPSVRRVWRLKPDRFALTNPDWQPFLQLIITQVQEGLGLEKQKLQAHLYELLLYHYSILDSVYLVVAHCGLWFNSPRPRAGGWFDTVGAGSDKLSADCWLSAPST